MLGVEHGFEAKASPFSASRIFSATVSCGARAQDQAYENLLGEVAALSAGDLVVHVDHGIGRYHRPADDQAAGAPHDCLEIHYAGGDKLYLPVENIELLTRYGSEDTEAQLDRLGGAGWQTRKARMKNASARWPKGLIAIAAAARNSAGGRARSRRKDLRRILRALPL